MPSGVAVVRVTGRAAGVALDRLAGPRPRPRRAALRPIGPADDPIDRGLVLWFPGPDSATGEDVAEFHLHGGRAVVGAVLDALAGLPDLRPAEPGEFTKRAFLNDRIDLTEAEGIGDLVAAETEAQRRQALRQMGGGLRALYDAWRGRLVRALAHLEADLEFPDEDLPDGVSSSVRATVAGLAAEIADHLADGRAAERVRTGIAVAILGAPNAGKSTLLNVLARRDAAIVSPVAGTTRDVVEVHLDLAGLPVALWDTAGLRHARDPVEAEGVRRSLARAEAADLRLVVLDGAAWPAVPPSVAPMLAGAGPGRDPLIVWAKADLRNDAGPANAVLRTEAPDGLWIAAPTGTGLDRLEAALAERVAGLATLAGGLAPTRSRHRAALIETLAALARVQSAEALELAAEDLRLAAAALGRITGRVDVEDLLDVVFRDFCIGK